MKPAETKDLLALVKQVETLRRTLTQLADCDRSNNDARHALLDASDGLGDAAEHLQNMAGGRGAHALCAFEDCDSDAACTIHGEHFCKFHGLDALKETV